MTLVTVPVAVIAKEIPRDRINRQRGSGKEVGQDR